MQKFSLTLFGILAIITIPGPGVKGHGRLVRPAGRSTLWRLPEFKKFKPEPDYDDTQSFCGGMDVQYGLNGGKCGVCGDRYDMPQPRPHESGGIYGRGIITGNYSMGQAFTATVNLTASHRGYFEFRLCPNDNPQVPVTQECLDKYLLPLADGSGTGFPIPAYKPGQYHVTLKLPENVKCRHCVLQWHYKTGNSHGPCPNGSYRLGCGDQETFRSCADITIN